MGTRRAFSLCFRWFPYGTPSYTAPILGWRVTLLPMRSIDASFEAWRRQRNCAVHHAPHASEVRARAPAVANLVGRWWPAVS